ncbi:GNAT family N-acetyltransferase [Flagellimonas meishanensis]|uniref:GNAT family N-acetyltransferase n=1 Tax=Flagellimonas meishanensis TaxID=2873264 RepID=UPI001CA78DED|nr:GNAT family N-acetyltransferase [[Muricauda] meishanensis]
MKEELKLNYLSANDAKSLCLLMTSNSEAFQRFFPKTLEQNQSIADSQSFILNKIKEIESKSEYTFAIRSNNDNSLAGLVILKNIDWKALEGELAYCLDQRSHGKGWATSSVKQVSSFAIEELGLKVLKIIAHKSNIASIRVAEKCRFKWKKTLSKSFQPPNEEPLNMELYELTYEG